MAENIIQFDGGETPLPKKIRDIVIIKDKGMSPATKFVYLAIKWSKSVLSKEGERFDPSYLFMKKRFGVNCSTYKKALDDLYEAGVVDISKRNCGSKEYLLIDLLIDNTEIAERIPSVIITTELLTMQQKLFLSLLWKILYINGDNNSVTTNHSSYKIAELLEEIGISKRSTYKTIKELSGNGFVPMMEKQDNGGYIIDMNVMFAIWEYEDRLWARYKMLGGKNKHYPTYIKPKAGCFHYDSKTNKIIKS